MDGPSTLDRIILRAEKVGGELGIPRDLAIVYARMEELDQHLEEIEDKKKDGWRFLRNIVRHMDGLLDRFLGK